MYGASLDYRYLVFYSFRYYLWEPPPALFEKPLYIIPELSEVSILSVFNGLRALFLTVLLVNFWLRYASLLHLLLLLICHRGSRNVMSSWIIWPDVLRGLMIETIASVNRQVINSNLS